MRCEFAYHAAIVERIKTIHGAEFDKMQRCWFVPAAQADRLMDAFPKASFDYDSITAALDAQMHRVRNFHESLVRLGVDLQVDASGAVCAAGENVSPLLREEIAKRSADLRPLVAAQQTPVPEQVEPHPVPQATPTLIERSIVWQAAQEPRQYRRWQRQRRTKLTQGELFRGD